MNTVGPSYSLGHGRIDVPSNFQKPPEAAVDSALLLANVEEPATTTPTSFAIDGEGHRAGGGEAASGGFETEKLGNTNDRSRSSSSFFAPSLPFMTHFQSNLFVVSPSILSLYLLSSFLRLFFPFSFFVFSLLFF